jgi:hypothetical protein
LSKWIYTRGEFHSEAYEVDIEPAGRRDQIEMTDWRVLLGLRMERNLLSAFLEAGWIFDRQVEFLRSTPSFDISSGFIARTGFRY